MSYCDMPFNGYKCLLHGGICSQMVLFHVETCCIHDNTITHATITYRTKLWKRIKEALASGRVLSCTSGFDMG